MFNHVHLTYEKKGMKPLDYGYVLKICHNSDLINYQMIETTAKNSFVSFISNISKKGSNIHSSHIDSKTMVIVMTAERLGISYIDAVCYIQERKNQSMENILHASGTIYIQYSGSYMSKMLGHIEKGLVKVDSIVYLQKVKKKDVKIVQWVEGKHFYAQIKGQDVIYNDQNKWNTFEGAENAVDAYIKEKHLEVV